jgi:hypothetical protein
MILGLWSLYVINILVFQQGDTLQFIENGKVVDTEIINTGTILYGDTIAFTRNVKISPDHTRYLIYEDEYHRINDSITTWLTCYKVRKMLIYERQCAGNRRIIADLTKIFDDVIVIVTSDKLSRNPTLDVIDSTGTKRIVHEGEWQRIVCYALSPDQNYIVLYCRGLYRKKAWDHIVCVDLLSGKEWQYMFPLCLSCKKGKVQVTVDNTGTTTISYNNEHRVFSKDGTLIEIFYTHSQP